LVARAAEFELDTEWETPPGNPLEHSLAGFAKILCSAVFITGRDVAEAAEAAENAGYFVSRPEERTIVTDTVVDLDDRAVHLTMNNGVTRTAKFYDDQGCVTLPEGAESVEFTPVKVTSNLPDAMSQPWPMGDVLPDEPLPAEVDEAKVAEAVAAAFDPPEGMTAAFVVTYKGRIIGERYMEGLDKDTQLASWSMGKSLTATLMGTLIQQGVYELWQEAPVDGWHENPDDPRAAIRIGDIMRMSSGLRFVAPQDPDYEYGYGYPQGYPDHLYVYTGAINSHEWAITRPAQWPPNTVGRYRNSDPLTINHLIRKGVEQELVSGDRSLRKLPAPGIRVRHRTQLGTTRHALSPGRRVERGTHIARRLGGVRQYHRAGLGGRWQAHLRWRLFLDQRHRVVPHPAGGVLHGGSRRTKHDHHPLP
jgi:hypothetical protein